MTAEAIAERGRVNVLVLGDSIACGSDTSRADRAFVPSWVSRFEAEHDVPVTVANRSLPGMTVKDGHKDARRWFRRRFPADLVILAYGVNDQTPSKYRQKPRLSADEFWGHSSTLAELCTPADIVFVTPLVPSRKWIGNTDLVHEYAKRLRRLAADRAFVTQFGTALADVTAVWPGDGLLANGWNHPNDDGHRLYADVLFDAVTVHQPVNVETL